MSAQGGTAGQKTIVATNLYRISSPTTNFVHYDGGITKVPTVVTLKQNKDDKRSPDQMKPIPKWKIHAIIDYLQTSSEHAHLFEPRGAFDGGKNLYVWRSKLGGGKTFDAKIGPSSPPDFTVVLKQVATIELGHLQAIVAGDRKPFRGPHQVENAINAVNAVMRMVPLQANSVYSLANRRAFFNPQSLVGIGSGLGLLSGFHSSVRPTKGSLVLNLDLTSAVIFLPGPLIGSLLEVARSTGDAARDLASQRFFGPRPDEKALKDLRRYVRKLKVVYSESYPRYQANLSANEQRRFGIEDIVDGDRFTFTDDEGKVWNLANYFQEKYGKRLDFPRSICVKLKSRPGHDMVFPLEMLSVPHGQYYKGSLHPEASRMMIDRAKKRPNERKETITQGFQSLQFSKSPYIADAGMDVNLLAESVSGRLIGHPTLMYGAGVNQPVRDGKWDSLRKTYVSPAIIKGWAVLSLDPALRRAIGRLQSGFVDPLQETLKMRGLKIMSPPVVEEIADGNVVSMLGSVLNQIMDNVDRIARQAGWNPAHPGQQAIAHSEILIICVLKKPHDDLRDLIKTWSERTTGIATQIVVGDKVMGRRPLTIDDQYLNNLALKINIKMGGINANLCVPRPWFNHKERIMVVGADVSHASPGSDAPSIAAITFNKGPHTITDYCARTRIQMPRLEIIQDFSMMLDEALFLWKDNLPTQIIVFRDGVSESEFETVKNTELTELDKLFHKRGMANAKVVFIIVGKRHHIRFFPTTGSSGVDNKSGNMPSGLVVDDHVVHPFNNDFYLQSQKPLMGTSRPAHYNVLRNGMGMSADLLQLMCFDFCHLFARSTTAVSIPAPTYYADLVCSRIKLHLDQAFGHDGSLSEGSANQVPIEQRLNELNEQCAIHRNQKNRMYFV